MVDSETLTLFAGNANQALAHDIARHLTTPLGRAYVGRFSDGEVNIELMENVRGRDVFIVQPTCPPVNEHLIELLVMVDAARRASAARITGTVPRRSPLAGLRISVVSPSSAGSHRPSMKPSSFHNDESLSLIICVPFARSGIAVCARARAWRWLHRRCCARRS